MIDESIERFGANPLMVMTVGIVANYISNNHIKTDEVAGLITTVHNSLTRLDEEPVQVVAKPKSLTAAKVKKLITSNGLVSLIDGRSFKTLKRHVGLHGYTPASYREAFGLPSDFPMVTPAYAAVRSRLAKSMGLGRAKKVSTPELKARGKPKGLIEGLSRLTGVDLKRGRRNVS